ncbi:MAG: 30S ribosomal protein S6 [Thermoguttaceae bacterium]
MAENVYEGMFILDSNQYGRDPGGVSSQMATMLESAGGTVMVSRLWEERRLAFPIKGHRKGTYWLTYFRLDPVRLVDIQRQCELNDVILRNLFLKVDPRIVDALVEHALASRTPSAETEEEKKPSDSEEGKKEEATVGAGAENKPGE